MSTCLYQDLSKSMSSVLLAVCLFHHMRTISSPQGSELPPNPEDQGNLTTVRDEFWLVPDSGLLTSAAPRGSASLSSLRQRYPTRCSAQGSLYLLKLQSSLFSVRRSPEPQSMCPPQNISRSTQECKESPCLTCTTRSLSQKAVQAQKSAPIPLEVALGLPT